jgi:hypothetical protein
MSQSTSSASANGPGRQRLGMSALARPQVRRGIAVIACALFVGLSFVASYVDGLHQPKFHKVPIAVAGPATLAHQLGNGPDLSVTVVPSATAAIRRIDHRKDFGAVTVTPTGITVYTAQAAGASVASGLAQTLPPALRAATGGRGPIHVTDLKPLPTSDPTGLTSFYLMVSLVVSNYIGAILFALAFGTKLTRETLVPRLLVAVSLALVIAIGEIGITNAIGPLTGHFFTLVLAAFLLGLTVSTVTMCLQSLFGVVGTAAAIVLFVVFGNPASGGALPFPLVPGLWRWPGPYTPSGAGETLIRNIAYFGGHGTGAAVITELVWLVAALGLTLVSTRLRPIGLRMKSDYDRMSASLRTV